jgi:hypothetical protein
MTELIRAFPQAAPIIGDILARQFDWPEADKVAERLAAMNPSAQEKPAIPPEIEQLIQQGQAEIQRLTEELQVEKSGNDIKMAEIAFKREELNLKQFEADTDRLKLGIANAFAPSQL